jgi:cytochrome c oxidase assembly factor CtaG
MRAIITTILFLVVAAPAAAHPGMPHHIGFGWTLDPWIVAPIAVSALLYIRGFPLLLAPSHNGRRSLCRSALLYAAGWLALTAALISPLHELGEALFTFHMIEHEIVMAVAAPLIVLSRPAAPLLWGLPRTARGWVVRTMTLQILRSTWNWLTNATTSTLLHGIAIWAWHAPALFDATVEVPVLHRLQHLSFFLTAVLFWWSVLWRSNRGVAAWHLFVTMLHTGILGALMALAPAVVYVAQTKHAAAFGFTPLEDQQLAGLVMWVPAGTVYAGAALLMVAQWISQSGRGAPDVSRKY